MKTTWLARRLGWDGNPLRRRSDRIAVCLGILLLAAFLLGAPLLSGAAIGWAGHAGAAGPRGEHTGDRIPAVRMSAGPARTTFAGGAFGYSKSLAGQTAPDLRPRTGHLAVVAREATAAVVATATLGIMLLCLAWAGRWVLNRRRLAAWEKAWAVIGPQWTKRFRQQRGPP
jgi:hypothetical protein